jgi:thymidylate synthase ThyX
MIMPLYIAAFAVILLAFLLRAQWEIRELARNMWELCMVIAPFVFANAGPNCDRCREKSCPGRKA